MKAWCLEVWGNYACFTRPEMKVERQSYDVMPPSAARAIFEAVLRKPAIQWKILKIEVLKEIKWISVKRNEVGSIITGPTKAMLRGEDEDKILGIVIEKDRKQRSSRFLKDVAYRIHARFDFIPPEDRKNEKEMNVRGDESPAKYAAMFERRAKKGQCFHRPYLGCREFACHFRLVKEPEKERPPIPETIDLKWMLYDKDYRNPKNPMPMFFHAKLENGVLDTDRNHIEVK